MKRAAKARISRSEQASAVGTAELRANLAKYLKQAKSGHRVVIRERGKIAYVLTKVDAEPTPDIFGCMRDRTEYTSGEVLNAKENWIPGDLP